METKELLRTLSDAHGVSGYEHRIAALVKEAFSPYCQEFKTDALGNVIAFRRGEGEGPRPRVMLAAHMDEIGLMVTKIDEHGFLKFTQVGGVDQRTLVAQEVRVHGKQELLGVIGAKPPHLLSPEERQKAIAMSDMVIDVGLPVEKVKELVRVGDMVTLNRTFAELANGCIYGKSLDDRAGVAVMYECLQQLARLHCVADVYAVATVQEEVGVRGATVSAYGVNPDIGVAIDVCHGDMPGVPEDHTSPMGKGPAVTRGGNIHPKVFEGIDKAAKEFNISYSLEIAPGPTGTDAWAIQVARSGIPTGLLSIPLRYMHTSVETMDMADIRNAGRLLAFFISKVDRAYLEEVQTWS